MLIGFIIAAGFWAGLQNSLAGGGSFVGFGLGAASAIPAIAKMAGRQNSLAKVL